MNLRKLVHINQDDVMNTVFDKVKRLAGKVIGGFGITVALCFGGASAHAQNVIFEGGAFLGEFSPACAEYGWQGRPYFHVQFIPAFVSGNENRTRLTFFLRNYAQSYTLPDSDFRPSFRPVEAGHTGWETSYFENPTRLRVTDMTPNRVRPGTNRVLMRGDIRNFNDRPGCEVSFTMHVVRRN